MKIKNLSVGQVVYVVEKVDSNILSSTKTKKRIKTIIVQPISISEISEDGDYVIASKNTNQAKRFYQHEVSKWKKEKPMTIHMNFGIYRLATKEERENKK